LDGGAEVVDLHAKRVRLRGKTRRILIIETTRNVARITKKRRQHTTMHPLRLFLCMHIALANP
jgi:hypothetical protein